ncbi:MAG: RNase P subunit p30 family protein [Candidatus Hydrothermarchaeales archaeon]
MEFIDLHVHSVVSSGVDTPSRLAYHADKLGIKIGLCDGQDLAKRGGIALGAEISAGNKGSFKDSIKALRGFDYLVVRGGSDMANRLAVSDSRIDILAHPELGRRDSGLDSFIARKAKENSVAVEVNLGALITSKRGQRVRLLKNIKKNLMLSRKYGFELIACTGAKSRYDLREADCVFELLKLVGAEEEEAMKAMVETPKKILEGSL